MDIKTAILAEMVVLWTASLLVRFEADIRNGKNTRDSKYIGDLFMGTGLSRGAWIVALGLILLVSSEILRSTSAARWPMYLGGMIVASSLVVEIVAVNAGIQALSPGAPMGPGENVARPI